MRLSRKWVTVSAVNMETITPMPSVVAKPTIVPVPRKNSTAHAIRVVMLESRIAVNARLKPESIALLTVLPFLSSSLTRSKMMTFASTAIPMDRMMPAMPGRDRLTRTRLKISASSTM